MPSAALSPLCIFEELATENDEELGFPQPPPDPISEAVYPSPYIPVSTLSPNADQNMKDEHSSEEGIQFRTPDTKSSRTRKIGRKDATRSD